MCRQTRQCPAGRTFAAVLLAVAVAMPAALARQSVTASGPRFEISFTARRAPNPSPAGFTSPSAGPTTGRRSSRRARPACRCSRAPSMSWRRTRPSPIGPDDLGHPIESLRDLPAGEYWVQPFVNVYTKFARADGQTVWLHMDQWEGQNWKRSPGNLFGDPVQMHFDPTSSTPIKLVADKVIPPVAGAGRHAKRQAHQDSESDPDQVVGPADLPRRDRAAAEGLRQASRREVSGRLLAGPLLARRAGRRSTGGDAAFAQLLARGRHAAHDLRARCSIRRRTTTTRTA